MERNCFDEFWRLPQMKRALVFFALLFATATVIPQDAPQDPRFATKIETAANGSKMFSITNRSPVPITAIVVLGEFKNARGVLSRQNKYFDSVEGHGSLRSAILPQETRAVMVDAPPRAADTSVGTFTLKAVIFEDGTSFGDEESVATILRGREFLWRNVSAVVSTLEAAKTTPVTKNELLRQLDEKQKAEKEERLKDVKMFGLLTGSSSAVAASAFMNAKANIDVPDNAVIPATAINQFADRYLNIRQRLINSKPQIPGTENIEAADASVPQDFEIRLGPGVKSEDVSVFYDLRPAPGSNVSGTLGGAGGQTGSRSYRLPVLIDGKPAHSLQAFIVGKGCAVQVIDIPDIAASLRSAEYDCVQLPLMNFTGRVEPSEALAGKKYRVRITLLEMTIARAEVDSDGVFHAQITDYSSDPHAGALKFYADLTGADLVPGAKSGGAMLEPINSAAIQHIALRPMADYGGEVVFHAVAF
jgi:hypothetical protein